VSGAASDLADLLTAGAGTFALTFLVALAAALAAMALVFLVSAVVVLERFARSARRLRSVALASAGWAIVLAPLARGDEDPRGIAAAALAVLVALAVVQALAWAALRYARPRALARAAAIAVVAGCALTFLGLPAFSAEPSPLVSGLGRGLLAAFGGAVLGLLPLATAGLLDARGSVEWFVATRYLFAKRRQTFVSMITLLCVAGVAAGVWLIITVLSVMNGAERTWREEIIGNRAHFTIHAAGGPIRDYAGVLAAVDRVPGVLGATPYVEGEGLVRGARGEVLPVRVRGIDPDRVGKVTDLARDLRPGSERALDALRTGPGDGLAPPLILGSELASRLGVGVGDALVLIAPFGGAATPLGASPRLERFRVAGVFQSSFFQYDSVYAYASLAAAQDFRRAGDVAHGIEVRTADAYRSRRVAGEVRAALDSNAYYTRDWKDVVPAFFESLKTQRAMMFVLLTMIMVVAAFAIVVTLVMMIMAKSSDIAILKTMGASDAAVERVFAIEGALIGLLGTALGVVAGVAVTTQLGFVQGQIEALTGIDALPPTIYQFSTVPWRIDPFQVAVVVAIAMVLALGGTLLPSRHGARLDPAEALRYE
jgi:lipoprotein-releasing system permease protein